MSRQVHETRIVIQGDGAGGVRAFHETTTAAGRYRRSLDEVADSTDALDRANGQAQDSFGGVIDVAGRAVGAVGGLTAGYAGLSSLIRADMIRDNVALADAIGANITALQQWQYAGEQVGISADKMGDILKDVGEKIGEYLANGGGEAKDVFEGLNLQVKDFIGLAPDQRLLKVAEALSRVDDAGQRSAYLEMLADDATRLAPLLEDNARKLREVQQQALEAGYAMSEVDARSVVDYSNAWQEVRGALVGVQNELSVMVADGGAEVLSGLAQSIRENADLVHYLDEALIMSAGVIASRYVPALAGKAQAFVTSQREAAATARSEMALAKQIHHRAVQDQAAAERSLGVARTMDMRRAAGNRLAVANQQLIASERTLTAATEQYNAVATRAGWVSRGLQGSLAMLGGPAGVAILAGAAILAMSSDYESAEERTRKLREETDDLVESLKNASLFEAYEASDKAADAAMAKHEELVAARRRLAEAEEKFNKGSGVSGAGQLARAQKDVRDLEQAYTALSVRAEAAAASIDGALLRMGASSEDAAEAVGVLEPAVIELAETYAKQVTQVEKLKAAKAKLQAVEAKDEEQAKTLALAIANINRQLAEEEARAEKRAEQKKDHLELMEEELAYLKAGEKAQYIANKLRGVSTEQMRKQGHELAIVAGKLYDEEQRIKAVAAAAKEAAKEAEALTDPYVEAWENATERVDAAFADVWRSAFDGSLDSFDDFADSLEDAFTGLLAELAHQALTKPIIMQLSGSIGQSFGIPGVGGADAAGAGGSGVFDMVSTANTIRKGFNNGFSSAVDFFNPSSGYTTMAVNRTAADLGYGYAADGMGPSVALVDSGGYVAQGLNAVGPGLAAYGFGQKYGVAGGVVGGAGSAALAGGIGGALGGAGFLSGATGALAGLGPVGWAMIAGAAILGANQKPSDKTQWAGFTGEDNQVYAGGEDGKKFSEENRDAATYIASALNRFNSALDQYSGETFVDSLQITVGSRDGINIKGSNSVGTLADLGYTPNGSANIDGDFDIYNGGDLAAALDAAVVHMAEQNGVLLDLYQEMAREGELLGDVYMRLHSQEQLVRESLEFFGIPFSAVGEDALRIADQLIAAAGGMESFVAKTEYFYQNFYSEQERAADLADQYRQVIADFNDEHGTAISSKEDLRAYVEAIQGTGDSADLARIAALELAPALVGLAEASEVVQAAQEAQAAQAVQAAQAARLVQDGAVQTALSGIGSHYDELWRAEQARYDAQMANLSDQLQVYRQLKSISGTISSTLSELSYGDLSVLTPAEQLAQARTEFAGLQVRAEAGDLDALGQLSAAGKTFLTASRGYNASGSAYLNDYADVVGVLESLQLSVDETADPQVKIEQLSRQMLSKQQELAQMAAQDLTAMRDLLGSNLDLAALLEGLPPALSSAISDALGVGAGGSSSSSDYLGNAVSGSEYAGADTDYYGDPARDAVNALYRDILDRNADTAGLEYWVGQLNSGMGLGDIASLMRDSDEYSRLDGSHANGLSFVPFDGYRAELHYGERVLTAAENKAYGGSGNQQALVDELRALRAEVSQLRAERAGDARTAEQQRDRQLRNQKTTTRLEALA